MYDASVWYECMEFEYGKTCMKRCERAALYACLKVCRNVSTDAMSVIMGELPWTHEVVLRACMYKIRKGLSLGGLDPVVANEVVDTSKEICKIRIREKLMDRWQCEWEASTKGRVTYEWIKDVRSVGTWDWFDMSLSLGYLVTG